MPRADRRRLLRPPLAGGEHGDHRADARRRRLPRRRRRPARRRRVGALDRTGARATSSGRVRRTAVGAALGLTAFCVTLLFGGLAFVRALRAPDAAHAAMAEVGCNGHVELCDRRLDEVTFAATHNSMSASRERRLLRQPADRQHRRPARQRGAGVPARPPLRRAVRDRRGPHRLPRRRRLRGSAGAELSPEEREAGDRAIEMLGAASDDERRRDVYLCHVCCELGAVHAADDVPRRSTTSCARTRTRSSFSSSRTRSTPADAIDALERGGLADRAYAVAAR